MFQGSVFRAAVCHQISLDYPIDCTILRAALTLMPPKVYLKSRFLPWTSRPLSTGTSIQCLIHLKLNIPQTYICFPPALKTALVSVIPTSPNDKSKLQLVLSQHLKVTPNFSPHVDENPSQSECCYSFNLRLLFTHPCP